MKKVLFPVLLVLMMVFSVQSTAQNDTTGTVIDEVVAVVGKHFILQSDIENQYIQMRMQGTVDASEPTMKCRILENLLFEKLLLHQADRSGERRA